MDRLTQHQLAIKKSGSGRSSAGEQISDDDLNVVYLVVQHKTELLDKDIDLKSVLNHTLDVEFVEMMHMCLFVRECERERMFVCVRMCTLE